MQTPSRLTPAWIGILLFSSVAMAQIAEPVSRVLPPPGIEIPASVRQELTERLEGARKRAASLTDPLDQADTQVYLKALELALHYGEFYGPKDFDKARFAASQVEQRLDALGPFDGNDGRRVIQEIVQPKGRRLVQRVAGAIA